MSSSAVVITPLHFWQIIPLYKVFVTALERDFTYIAAPSRRRIRRQNSPLRLLVAMLKPHRFVYLAKQKGAIVGYVIGGLVPDGTANVDWLYVDSDIRGHNIGLKMLSKLLQRFNREGATSVTLVTYNYTKYYARQGFKVVRKVESDGVNQDLMKYVF